MAVIAAVFKNGRGATPHGVKNPDAGTFKEQIATAVQ